MVTYTSTGYNACESVSPNEKIILRERRRRSRHANPNDRARKHAPEHKPTTAHTLHKRSTDERKDELEAGAAKIDIGLIDAVFVASDSEDSGQEVGENTVAGLLCENGEAAITGKTVAGSTGLEESAVVPHGTVCALSV